MCMFVVCTRLRAYISKRNSNWLPSVRYNPFGCWSSAFIFLFLLGAPNCRIMLFKCVIHHCMSFLNLITLLFCVQILKQRIQPATAARHVSALYSQVLGSCSPVCTAPCCDDNFITWIRHRSERNILFLCQMQLMNNKGPAGGAVTGADRTRSSSHHGYLAEGYSSTEDSAISSEPLSRHPSNDSIDRLTPTGTNSTSKTSGMLCHRTILRIPLSAIGYGMSSFHPRGEIGWAQWGIRSPLANILYWTIRGKEKFNDHDAVGVSLEDDSFHLLDVSSIISFSFY